MISWRMASVQSVSDWKPLSDEKVPKLTILTRMLVLSTPKLLQYIPKIYHNNRPNPVPATTGAERESSSRLISFRTIDSIYTKSSTTNRKVPLSLYKNISSNNFFVFQYFSLLSVHGRTIYGPNRRHRHNWHSGGWFSSVYIIKYFI